MVEEKKESWDTIISKINEEIPIIKIARKCGFDFSGDEGSEIKARCPIHGDGVDTHSSAKIYTETNSIYCWGCGRSFDVIDLVRWKYNLSFVQAINILNEKLGTGGLKQEKDIRYKNVGSVDRFQGLKIRIKQSVKEIGFENYKKAAYLYGLLTGVEKESMKNLIVDRIEEKLKCKAIEG